MYRTNDPRFRRRLNEIGQTLENANETAQSSLYIFGQTYIKPCFGSVTSCVTSCVDASCPSLNLSQHQRERLRRQRGRSTRGRAELNFDFYDDWDDDNESDALLGWGNDEFDRVVAGGGGTYGSTITHTQPSRQKGSMSYPRGRRKSTGLLPHDGDPTIISSGSGGGSFFGKLFGGKALKYKPSAAGLQEHPGAATRRRGGGGGDLNHQTEGEALLEDHEYRTHRRSGLRGRSGTAMSAETSDSYSSRGDIFPSDDEHDAVPLDDEFAMVLERRISQNDAISGNSGDSGNSIVGGSIPMDRRGKRPSAGSRQSTHRTFSSRSSHSVRRHRGQQQPGSEQQSSPATEDGPALEDSVPSIKELKHEEGGVIGDGDEEEEEEGEEGQNTTAMEQTSSVLQNSIIEELSSKEASPRSIAPPPTSTVEDLSLPPSLLLPPDDGEQQPRKPSGKSEDESKT